MDERHGSKFAKNHRSTLICFMRKITFLLLFLIYFSSLYSQKYTISGYITDASSGEKLIGANVYDKYILSGATSNTYGFYSLTLPKDTYNIAVSYVGYQTQYFKIDLKANQTLNIKLIPVLELEEFVLTADQIERIEETTKMSTVKIPIAQIKSIPALFGEVDVLKALQLLPGVQSGMEGSSGLYVRGGGPDQNLILLDGTPVYNASHLFGFFSVFNADAIKNVELIKGGFPARYGGRLSSVIDISLKEGNLNKFHVEGSLGLIASKILVEGPIIKDRTSFIVSFRRTYLDLIAQPIIRLATSSGERISLGYYFYDINAKINHKLTNKDHLYLSLYTGDDKFYMKAKPASYLYDGVLYTDRFSMGLGWGNLTSALRWNHQFSNKLFSNLTLTYSQYNFEVYTEEESFEEFPGDSVIKQFYSVNYVSGINDVAAKFDFDYVPNPNHFIKFGTSWIYHTFKPGVTAMSMLFGGFDTTTSVGAKDVYAHEMAFYLEDDWKLSDNLKANIGVHYSGFLVNDRYYNHVQPRLAIRYLFRKNWSLKASYASMQQYIHLLTNTTVGLPTDLWVPATEKILPQNSQQVAAGFAKSFSKGISLSVEGYYKWMENLIEYTDGATWLNTSDDWQEKVEIGKGWSYGGEIFVEKKLGSTTGWVGYTLSWTERQFRNINFGEKYPYKYDRRHDISVVLNHKFTKRFDMSLTWVYGTGNAITLPVVRAYSFPNPYDWYTSEVEYFDKKNDYRMAAYHRLDYSANYNFMIKAVQTTINFSVYNAYSRRNPFFYYFGTDWRTGNRALFRVSLFPIIPSLSVNFKF